jgi:hypothetical protein
VKFPAIPHLVLLLLCIGLATVAFAQTNQCPSSVVTVDVTSPSGSGTYSTPVHFEATASSSASNNPAITGYAVYTNQWSDIPFAEGQPMYLNGSATLNAWVILPLTSSGGSLSQDVYVRAWDGDGNCGDSATFDISTDGATIPSTSGFPSNYTPWTDTETDQRDSDSGSEAGWWDCGTTACAGGTYAATTSFAFGQTPEQDSGGSIAFTVANSSSGEKAGDSADGLFWYKVPPTGEQSSLQNFVWDFYFYLSSETATNASGIEFDVFSVINGYKYMIGTQCNYAPPGGGTPIWDAWDGTAGTWVPAIPNTEAENDVNGSSSSAVPCPNKAKFTTGAWHHAQYYLQITEPDTEYPQGRILYGAVSIDGTATQWNISAPAVSTTWPDILGFQHQLDILVPNSGTITLQEWVDPDNFYGWPQD